MKQITVVVTIPNVDVLVDPSSISFEFESTTATGFTNITSVFVAIQNFFNSPVGGGSSVCTYMSRSVDFGTPHCTLVAYDITGHLDGTPHGSPVASLNWTLATPATTANPFPEGVAACLSFRGDYGTDVEFGGTPPGASRPRSRDRNRVYLGPLNSTCAAQNSTTHATFFTTTFINDCLAQFNDLCSAHTTSTDTWHLRQWSRKNAALKVPTEAWMDTRVDYQRRRSDQGGNRTFITLPGV